MPYKHIKCVTPSVDSRGEVPYFRKGRVYTVAGTINKRGLGKVNNDSGLTTFFHMTNCMHLNGANWVACDQEGKEI